MEYITPVTEDLPKGKGSSPGVYIIEHPGTDKAYIGSSGDLGARKRLHRSDLKLGKNSNGPLQSAYNDDPNINFLLFPTATKEEAVALEQKLLDHEMPKGKLFNIAVSATAMNKGMTLSEETRRKIGQAGIGREPHNKGKTLSEQHRASVIASRENLSHEVSIQGKTYPSIAEAARQLNLSFGCVIKRVNSKTSAFSDWIRT